MLTKATAKTNLPSRGRHGLAFYVRRLRCATLKQIVFATLCTCFFTGCRSLPYDPESTGLVASSFSQDITSQQMAHVKEEALAAYRTAFGGTLPASFVIDSESTGWFTPTTKELIQIRVEAEMSRDDFARNFPKALWHEEAIPSSFRAVMSLPADAPKDYMTCYVGKINHRPACIFWSDYSQELLLVVDVGTAWN